MSAIDNKHKLEIISVMVKPYPAKGDRKAGELYLAQCVFHAPDQSVQVGQLMLPQHLQETPAGSYLAEFELAVNYKLEVVPRITVLHPHGKTSAPLPSSSMTSSAPAKVGG